MTPPMLIPPGEVERIVREAFPHHPDCLPLEGWCHFSCRYDTKTALTVAQQILTAATSAHEKAMRELVYARSQVIASVCTAMDVAIALHNDPKSKPWSREHLCDFLETLRHDLSKLAALSSVTFGGGK